MPSFLMDLAHQIKQRLQVDLELAVRLAEREAARLASNHPSINRPEITESTAITDLNRFQQTAAAYDSSKYSGQGLVICAGGPQHFRYAWVCINMLRLMGCLLPVELWHFGEYELDERMADLVRPVGVKCVDALKVRQNNPTRNLLGYAIKPYAMLHSSFETVLLLDADNVPIVDLTPLFTWDQLAENGAIFWPDESPIEANNPIWRLLSVERPSGPSFETGQIILRKRRVWAALNVTSYLVSHGDFYYRYLRGDRDCFQVGWLVAQTPYAIVPHPMKRIPGTMLQHDFYGKRIFQHRNGFKWDDRNQRSQGFAYESECIAFLKELELKWDGSIAGRRDRRA